MKYLLLAVLLAAPAVSVRAAEKPAELVAGYRAMSFPLPEHQLRFIKEGDRVDVMTVFEIDLADKGKKDRVTATIFQNVLVLSVDHSIGAVLLALNPNEMQYAALFSDKEQSLWLARRMKGDVETPPMEMASARKLFR